MELNEKQLYYLRKNEEFPIQDTLLRFYMNEVKFEVTSNKTSTSLK